MPFNIFIPVKGDFKRRTRKCQTPHAEMPNAARGNAKRRTRGLQSSRAAFLTPPKGNYRLNLLSASMTRRISSSVMTGDIGSDRISLWICSLMG